MVEGIWIKVWLEDLPWLLCGGGGEEVGDLDRIGFCFVEEVEIWDRVMRSKVQFEVEPVVAQVLWLAFNFGVYLELKLGNSCL